ncbi:MAG: 2-oxoacid:acceptor oxidoreductase family protein [Thermodesulfobacteriota bacterium]|nr:2-oxoacid:acceptor oxidoreductase family protein [Thermodesulfobacteriota bacterium]
MEERLSSKNDIIFAGLGGMGVLMAGHILSRAALSKYKHVSWLPSYGVEKRGGLCECIVIFSNEEIASPIIDKAQTVIVFDGSQVETFEHRIRPGGTMLVESSGIKDGKKGGDYKLIRVPGLEIATSIGAGQINNFVLLGAYVGLTGAIQPELVEDEMEKRFGTKKEVFANNREAFKRGIELGRTLTS